MRNAFAPIFLISLCLLFSSHFLALNTTVMQFVLVLVFLSALGCFYFKKYTWSYFLIAFSIGLLITVQFLKEKEAFYDISQSPFPLDIPAEEYVTLYGKLKAFPEIGNGESVLTLETFQIEYQRQKIPVHFNTRLTVKGDLRQLYWGETISVSARIFKNHFTRNFYPNGMEDYVLSKKIHFNGSSKTIHMVNVEDEAPWIWKLIGKWRNAIREVIEKKYGSPGKNGKTDPKGVFLEATLLGDQGKLELNQKEQLITAGIYHIFAISGANIAVIALISLSLLKFLRISYRKRYMVSGLLLLLFLILSGITVSAERAVWMALLIFLARILYLDVDILNIISVTGLLFLIKNPAQFLDAGFILTFTLTAGIVIGRKIFLPLLNKWKVLRLNTHAYINEFLSANLSAALISLPISLYFFKQYSLIGFAAGLILLPLSSIITTLSVLLIALPLISTGISGFLLIVLNIPLQIFDYLAAFFAEAGRSLVIYRGSPPLLLVVSVFIAFYLLSAIKSKSYKIMLGVFILASIGYMTIAFFYYAPKNLEVFYLDVGQGDSELVVFPGGDALLIDAGGAYYSSDAQAGLKTVLPFLLEKKIKIKWAAISHFHPDHARGIVEILPVIQPGEIWISSEPKDDPSYDILSRKFSAPGLIKKLHAPFQKRVGKNSDYTIELLAPNTVFDGTPRNNHSQVIKVSGPYHSFLFTGDIESEVETRLVESNFSKLRADVLKVPHHGSRTSSNPVFLKCAAPRWAIFSYARDNRFHFPHKETTRNYKSQKIAYLSTALHGGIQIISMPGRLKIELSR